MKKIELFALTTIPLIKPGDPLSDLIVEAMTREKFVLKNGDVIIISSKIVAKAEGRIVNLDDVSPSMKAKLLAWLTGKKVKEVEVMLRECKSVMGEVALKSLYKRFGSKTPIPGGIPEQELKSILQGTPSLLLVEMPDGRVCTSSGEDDTNVEGKNMVALLPKNPNASARNLRSRLQSRTGIKVAVIISDSEIRVLRQGSADIAIGIAGLKPIKHDFGKPCLFGKPKIGGVDALADLLTAASNILMGQTTERIPVVIARGVEYEESDEGSGPLEVTGKMLIWNVTRSLFSNIKLQLCNWISKGRK